MACDADSLSHFSLQDKGSKADRGAKQDQHAASQSQYNSVRKAKCSPTTSGLQMSNWGGGRGSIYESVVSVAMGKKKI